MRARPGLVVDVCVAASVKLCIGCIVNEGVVGCACVVVSEENKGRAFTTMFRSRSAFMSWRC